MHCLILNTAVVQDTENTPNSINQTSNMVKSTHLYMNSKINWQFFLSSRALWPRSQSINTSTIYLACTTTDGSKWQAIWIIGEVEYLQQLYCSPHFHHQSSHLQENFQHCQHNLSLSSIAKFQDGSISTMNNEKFIKTSKPKDKLIKHASLITYSAFRINIKTTNNTMTKGARL